MKILSIDVGIKNLAYCLFYIKDEHTIEIDSWDVINLLENKEIPLCSGTCKNNSPCKHNSTYHKNNTYYCKMHAKKSQYLIPTQTLNKQKLAKSKIQHVKDFCQKHMLDVSGCRIKKDYIARATTFIDKKVLVKVSHTNASDVNLVVLGRNIQTSFDSIFSKHTIDAIVIENQISPIANRMKTLQGMIAQYFIMKQVSTIDFVSSSNKLKNFIKPKQKLTYNERKKMGISVIQTLSQTNNFLSTWLDFFNKHKKKDDLADSFLQGLWYVKEHKIYTE